MVSGVPGKTQAKSTVNLKVDRVADGKVVFNGGSRVEDGTGVAQDSSSPALMELDLVTQDVRSNQHISIVGQEFQTEGVGLKGHLERKYVELLDKGHATYFNEKR